jgi:hypothetical protein
MGLHIKFSIVTSNPFSWQTKQTFFLITLHFGHSNSTCSKLSLALQPKRHLSDTLFPIENKWHRSILYPQTAPCSRLAPYRFETFWLIDVFTCYVWERCQKKTFPVIGNLKYKELWVSIVFTLIMMYHIFEKESVIFQHPLKRR